MASTIPDPLGPLDPADVDAERLRRLTFGLARALRRAGGTEDLGPAAIGVLFGLLRRGPSPIGELADTESVTTPTMTGVIDRLERAGFVERTPSTTDGRVRMVSITDAGIAHLRATRASRVEFLAERLAQLTPEQRISIHEALDALEALVPDQPSRRGRFRR